MEVHAPHEAIRSFRTFCVHILTIIIGIVLASGVEQCRETRREDELAARAIAGFRAELTQNRATLAEADANVKGMLDDLRKIGLFLEQTIQAAHGRQPAPPLPSEGFSCRDSRFAPRSAAWDSATAAGALAHVNYDTVKDVAQVYALQRLFESRQLEVQRAVSDLSSSRADVRNPETATLLLRSAVRLGSLDHVFQEQIHDLIDQTDHALARLPRE